MSAETSCASGVSPSPEPLGVGPGRERGRVFEPPFLVGFRGVRSAYAPTG